MLPMRFFQGFPILEESDWTSCIALFCFLLLLCLIAKNYNYFDRKPDVRKKTQ